MLYYIVLYYIIYIYIYIRNHLPGPATHKKNKKTPSFALVEKATFDFTTLASRCRWDLAVGQNTCYPNVPKNNWLIYVVNMWLIYC